MSEREGGKGGGGARVRNGMLVVEGEQIIYCCRDLARWCTIRYREMMLTVWVPLFECVFACRGSENLHIKRMVGM